MSATTVAAQPVSRADSPAPGPPVAATPARPRLVLVGGGPACATVVLRLAELAAAPGAGPPPAELVLVDPAGETGGGDPHATGISAALLLNDNLAMIDSTGIGFTGWLRANQERWAARLAGDPDPRVAGWLRANQRQLASGELAGLFLPRALFGDFIRELFARACRVLARYGVVVRVVQDAVTAVRPATARPWRVVLAGGGHSLYADAVLLGVGSLEAEPACPGHPGAFTYRQARDLPAMERRLRGALSGHPAGARRVVVLGSSAAACEVLYALAGSTSLAPLLEEVTVLSHSGRLPDGLPSGTPGPFDCHYLPELVRHWRSGRGSAKPAATSAAMVEALVADVARGREQGYTIVDILPALGPAFGAAFPLLPPAQQRRFTEVDFLTYRRTIRHTSRDYATGIRRLVQRGLLRLRAGPVTGLGVDSTGALMVPGTGEHPAVRAAAVFDCRGFAGASDTAHPVVADLLATGTAALNRTGRGLRVNDRFEAAPGLFVLGQALAGTAQGIDYIWSLENIPRIHLLARRVARAARDRLVSSRPRRSRHVG